MIHNDKYLKQMNECINNYRKKNNNSNKNHNDTKKKIIMIE